MLWEPLGPEPVAAFRDAYAEHPAGIEHDFVIAACGHRVREDLDPLIRLLEPFSPRVEVFDGPRIDLRTYRELIDRLPETEEFVFANSYARPLADDWMAKMVGALRLPGVGIVGVGGSYESRIQTTPYHLGFLFLPWYPRFPNPHVRTSCFAIGRSAAEAVDWLDVTKKEDAWRLESSRRSFTRQLDALGLRSVVVDREGAIHETDDWRESATWRAGEQRNLLVADLRSDEYANATPDQRAVFESWAWGRPE